MNACQTPKLAGIAASLDATQPIRNEILPLERFFETGLFRLMRTNRLRYMYLYSYLWPFYKTNPNGILSNPCRIRRTRLRRQVRGHVGGAAGLRLECLKAYCACHAGFGGNEGR
jgi:hypothetical protein